MIDYIDSAENLIEDQCTGFFVGWPNPPVPGTLLKILQQSGEIVLAVDTETSQLIGFINAVTDGVLSAYIPLLEVLPEYQHRGIGRKLVELMLEKLDGYYMIDLVCDDSLKPFYEHFGMSRTGAMVLRDYSAQSGKSE